MHVGRKDVCEEVGNCVWIGNFSMCEDGKAGCTVWWIISGDNGL